MRLVMLSAVFEIAVGLGFLVFPGLVASLLLGSPLDVSGSAIARVAGVALLSLGLACWISPGEPRQFAPSLGLVVYNLRVATCLVGLGLVQLQEGSRSKAESLSCPRSPSRRWQDDAGRNLTHGHLSPSHDQPLPRQGRDAVAADPSQQVIDA